MWPLIPVIHVCISFIYKLFFKRSIPRWIVYCYNRQRLTCDHNLDPQACYHSCCEVLTCVFTLVDNFSSRAALDAGMPCPFTDTDNLIREIPPSTSLSLNHRMLNQQVTQHKGMVSEVKGKATTEREIKNKKKFTAGCDTICSWQPTRRRTRE